MVKTIRLLDYRNRPKEITIKDFEKAIMCIFEIKSGDGVLTVIYADHYEQFDSSDNRMEDFNDGMWIIEPKNIDVIGNMKEHDDTDGLDEAMLKYGNK